MGTKKLNPFMLFMKTFRKQNKGKGWSVVEMAKEGGKEWNGRNGTTRKKGGKQKKKIRGGALSDKLIGELSIKINTIVLPEHVEAFTKYLKDNFDDEKFQSGGADPDTYRTNIIKNEYKTWLKNNEGGGDGTGVAAVDGGDGDGTGVDVGEDDGGDDPMDMEDGEGMYATETGVLKKDGGRRRRKRRGGSLSYAEYTTGGNSSQKKRKHRRR